MFGFVSKSELEKQEKLFEARLEDFYAVNNRLEKQYNNLLQKYEDNLEQLRIAVAHEEQLNEQTGKLSRQLLEATSLSFPEKKFNVQKSVELLTRKLSAKTLATFLFKLVEALGESHLQTLNQYLLRKITSNKSQKNEEV